MERFALLSVFSRVGALAILAVSYAFGHSISQQVLGVMADVILAIVTGLVLRRANAARFELTK